MKLVRILAIVVIVAFVAEIINAFIPGFIDGWNEAGDSKDFNTELVNVSVKPIDGAIHDSLLNSTLNKHVPYTIQEISTRGALPSWYKYAMIIYLPFGLFTFYGIYCLIRMIISVTRGQVFTRKNVKRMRFFIYSSILIGGILETTQYLIYQEWTAQIILKGYEITRYEVEYPWLEFLVLALFTEIFAVGVKIKEEQDLTI